MLLQSMWGAHIQEPKKYQVLQGMGDINTRFALLDVIKESEYGAVYLCENSVNHNRLVIKKVAGTKEGYKESTMLSNLQHPNVINIYGTSTEEDVYIVVMEYLSGGSLNDRLVNPWQWKKAVKTIKDISQGMAFIHANNLIHGNLRPSNVLFTGNGEAKVTDCALNEHYRGGTTEANWYVYPNQPKNKLADIYSVGAILFEMVSGTVPSWKRGEVVVNERFRSLPFDLQDLLKRMLAAVPKDRYRSFDEVIKELNGLMNFDKRKHIKKRKQTFSGMLKFLLFLLILSSLSALAFFFPEITSEIIESLKDAYGLR